MNDEATITELNDKPTAQQIDIAEIRKAAAAEIDFRQAHAAGGTATGIDCYIDPGVLFCDAR
jgi:hypothetical protein